MAWRQRQRDGQRYNYTISRLMWMVTDAKLQQERMEERLSVVERDLENRTFDTQGLRTSIERQVTAVQGDVAATLKSLDYDGKLPELKSKLREIIGRAAPGLDEACELGRVAQQPHHRHRA